MTGPLSALGDLAGFVPHTALTKVQERVIPSLLSSNDSLVVAAPTGSGKTLLLEVAMLKLFRQRLTEARSGAPAADRVHGAPDARGGTTKAVYICPIKALASEKYELWRNLFAPLSVVIETGDQDRERQQQHRQQQHRFSSTAAASADDAAMDEGLQSVATADIIVTTPERWDSITRRWKEHTVLSIVNSVALLLLDEIHTVNEDRGAALEAVVSRMKAIKAQQQQQQQQLLGGTTGVHTTTMEAAAELATVPGDLPRVRFVAISGTLPNIEDFAEWLEVKPSMRFSFSSRDRPVPLTIKVLGFTSSAGGNPFGFDRFLSFRLFHLIRQYSQGKPAVVFCPSRKEASASAQRLVMDLCSEATRMSCHRGASANAAADNNIAPGLEPSQAVMSLANTATDKQLRQCLLVGIAFHHAALTAQDRHLVEQMFREQYVAVVCTTTTLALGVNLPAHLVIVKGTTFFKSGKRDDVPLSEVAQMCGRAGRPGLDDHGVALVLTTDDKVRRYESLVGGDAFTTVESRLHCSMIEHVNAEVALRTIHSFASGLDWIRTTFFWIRLRKCPSHYGLRFATKAEEAAFEPQLFAERLMRRVLAALYEEECVDIRSMEADTQLVESGDGESMAAPQVGGDSKDIGSDTVSLLSHPATVIESTRVGRNMARMYILFDTVKTFNEEVRARLHSAKHTISQTTGDTPEEVVLSDGDNEHPNCLTETVTPEAVAAPTPAPSSAVELVAGTPEAEEGRQTPRVFARAAAPVHLRRPFRLQDVLALCCRSAELDEIGLRQGDKGPLNEMNKLLKFPIKSGHKGGREVRENWHKSYVLIQGQLAQLPIAEVSLRNDFTRLWVVLPRVTRFLSEYARFTGSYSFFLFANLLLRCVEQKVWPDGFVLRQLEGVSDAVAKSLSRAGYRNFDSLRTADPRKLEAVCGRLPPYGNHLQAQVRDLPQCLLTVERVAGAQEGPAADLRYRVTIRIDGASEPDAAQHGVGAGGDGSVSLQKTAKGSHSDADAAQPGRRRRAVSSFVLIAGVPQRDCLLLLRYISADALLGLKTAAATGGAASVGKSATFEFTVPRAALSTANSTVELALVAEHWVGSDTTLTIDAPTLRGNGVPTAAGDSNLLSTSKLSALDSVAADRHSITAWLAKKAAATDEKVEVSDDKGSAGGKPARARKLEKNLRDSTAAQAPSVEATPAAEAKPAASDRAQCKETDAADSEAPPSSIPAEGLQVPVDPAQTPATYAATAARAKASFEDMLQDLKFIQGTASFPSEQGKMKRREARQTTPTNCCAAAAAPCQQPPRCPPAIQQPQTEPYSTTEEPTVVQDTNVAAEAASPLRVVESVTATPQQQQASVSTSTQPKRPRTEEERWSANGPSWTLDADGPPTVVRRVVFGDSYPAAPVTQNHTHDLYAPPPLPPHHHQQYRRQPPTTSTQASGDQITRSVDDGDAIRQCVRLRCPRSPEPRQCFAAAVPTTEASYAAYGNSRLCEAGQPQPPGAVYGTAISAAAAAQQEAYPYASMPCAPLHGGALCVNHEPYPNSSLLRYASPVQRSHEQLHHTPAMQPYLQQQQQQQRPGSRFHFNVQVVGDRSRCPITQVDALHRGATAQREYGWSPQGTPYRCPTASNSGIMASVQTNQAPSAQYVPFFYEQHYDPDVGAYPPPRYVPQTGTGPFHGEPSHPVVPGRRGSIPFTYAGHVRARECQPWRWENVMERQQSLQQSYYPPARASAALYSQAARVPYAPQQPPANFNQRPPMAHDSAAVDAVAYQAARPPRTTLIQNTWW